jgi:PilZ domain
VRRPAGSVTPPARVLSSLSVTDPTRRYERLDVELPLRLFVPSDDGLRFEAFGTSRNLGLGGLFMGSQFLLPRGLELSVELALPERPLVIRSRVVHVVGLDHANLVPGIGVEFLDVDSAGRELLLRSFTPPRYRAFHQELGEEFPHLKKAMPLRDISLILNLWEEWKVRQDGGPALTASGAPTPPTRRPGEPADPAAVRAGRRPRAGRS